MTQVAVVGSIIVDLAVRTSRMPLVGENLQAESFTIGPGGKGANSAVALARAGGEAVLVGCIGDDDFGRMELHRLRQENVNLEGVQVDAESATGVAIIMVDAEGENTILVVNGANDCLSPEAVVRSLLPHRDTLSGILVNFEVPEPAVAAAVRFGRDQGVPVIIDAGPPRQYAPESWADCTVLTPNELETEVLVGYSLSDEAKAEQAARELWEAGPQAIVVKLGSRGALLATSEGSMRVPAYTVPVVDTTGAGDAFSATLAVAVAEGLPLEEAVRRANAAGALAVTRWGAMPAMPTREEVDGFMTRHDR